MQNPTKRRELHRQLNQIILAAAPREVVFHNQDSISCSHSNHHFPLIEFCNDLAQFKRVQDLEDTERRDAATLYETLHDGLDRALDTPDGIRAWLTEFQDSTWKEPFASMHKMLAEWISFQRSAA